LAEIVMKLSRDTIAFFFLGSDQAAGQSVDRFFGRLSIRYIDARTNVAPERAVGFKPRNAKIQDPAVNAVKTSETVFHLEVDPIVKRRRVDLQTAIPVVRMYRCDPSVTQILFQGPSCEVKPTLIEERTEFVCTRHPDQHRSGVCH
jgi:hypothetical protein